MHCILCPVQHLQLWHSSNSSAVCRNTDRAANKEGHEGTWEHLGESRSHPAASALCAGSSQHQHRSQAWPHHGKVKGKHIPPSPWDREGLSQAPRTRNTSRYCPWPLSHPAPLPWLLSPASLCRQAGVWQERLAWRQRQGWRVVSEGLCVGGGGWSQGVWQGRVRISWTWKRNKMGTKTKKSAWKGKKMGSATSNRIRRCNTELGVA